METQIQNKPYSLTLSVRVSEIDCTIWILRNSHIGIVTKVGLFCDVTKMRLCYGNSKERLVKRGKNNSIEQYYTDYPRYKMKRETLYDRELRRLSMISVILGYTYPGLLLVFVRSSVEGVSSLNY